METWIKKIAEQIIETSKNGKAIPPWIREEVQMRFNVDISNVKVYAGAEAQKVLRLTGSTSFVADNAVFIDSEFNESELRRSLHQAAYERCHQMGGGR